MLPEISGIIGGSYTNFSSIDVEAQKGTTQINGAAAGGKSGYGFNGAFAYGSVKNTTHAYISDATVGGILTGEVNVKAGEVPVVKTQETLDKETTELANEKTKVDGKTTLTANAKTRMKDALQKESDESKKNAAQTAKNKIILEGDTTTQETGIGVDTTGKVYLLEGDETSSIAGLPEMHVLIAAQFYLQLRSVTQCDRAPNAPPCRNSAHSHDAYRHDHGNQ